MARRLNTPDPNKSTKHCKYITGARIKVMNWHKYIYIKYHICNKPVDKHFENLTFYKIPACRRHRKYNKKGSNKGLKEAFFLERLIFPEGLGTTKKRSNRLYKKYKNTRKTFCVKKNEKSLQLPEDYLEYYI